MAAPSYLNWLIDTGERQVTACGREIEIWQLNPQDDAEILSNWARHFRNHYIADADLAFMAGGTGLSHPDYLRTLLFPDSKVAPGPSLRSGDFGEIVVADFIEYSLGYLLVGSFLDNEHVAAMIWDGSVLSIQDLQIRLGVQLLSLGRLQPLVQQLGSNQD